MALIATARPLQALEGRAVQSSKALQEYLQQAAPRSIEATLDRLAQLEPDDLRQLAAHLKANPNPDWSQYLSAVPGHAMVALAEFQGEQVEPLQVALLTAIDLWGRASDLPTAFQVAAFETAGGIAPEHVTRALETTLRAFLKRDWLPTLSSVRTIYPGTDTALRLVIVRSLGGFARNDSIDLLLSFLGKDLRLDVTIMSQVNRIARADDVAPTNAAHMKVRSLLASGDPFLRREAVLACGLFDDYEAVPTLIELLSDDYPGVQGNASWSLQRLTGKRLAATRAAWSRWFEGESVWWRDEAPQLLSTLSSSSDAQVVAAIIRIGQKRLYRDELARALLTTLRHSNPDIVRLTCATLSTLRSHVPVPALRDLEQHPNPAVRRKAHATLVAITGSEQLSGVE